MNKKMKRNIAIATWFFGVLIVALMLFGCVCPQCDKPTYEGNPEFKPLPPEKLNDLLYKDELLNIAYKSPTIKDIIGEKDFN